MRTAALVAYRAASDVVGKGALFVITVVAARQLSPEGFGIFAIGTTIGFVPPGWLGSSVAAIVVGGVVMLICGLAVRHRGEVRR